eukprot:scaffold379_cov235-Pinguiococcus_pyrenoidosus.AAC.16
MAPLLRYMSGLRANSAVATAATRRRGRTPSIFAMVGDPVDTCALGPRVCGRMRYHLGSR